MSESNQTQTSHDALNPTQGAELSGTQHGFDMIQLPPEFSRRRLETADAQSYVDFDDWASFEGNPDTPPAHRPDHFTAEEITASIEQGDVFEGLFDDQGGLIATMWLTPGQQELEIANLVVHPSYRDRGIGKYFMDA